MKIFVLIFLSGLCKGISCESWNLKKVVVLGRHNIRAPLANVEETSPNVFPKWKDIGYLTTKGAILETAMGAYFSKWLTKEGLFQKCPEQKSVFIYANAKQRLIESANAFVLGAFRNCNITVHHKNVNKGSDPVFFPVIHNGTEAFKAIATKEMQEKIDGTNLNDVYAELNKILDFGNSELCKKGVICNLVGAKNEIILKVGEEPEINGPLAISNGVVDTFLMSYYDGLKQEDIAWGKVTDQLKQLTKISKQNQNVRFNSTTVAKDICRPLLRNMTKSFLDKDTKFAVYMGHDSNINTVLAAMDFKPHVLPGQLEYTPIGGNLVFQKWHSKTKGKDYLKVEYIYQSSKDIRNGTLATNKTPNRVVLEMKKCTTNKNGFCLWNDFLIVLKSHHLIT